MSYKWALREIDGGFLPSFILLKQSFKFILGALVLVAVREGRRSKNESFLGPVPQVFTHVGEVVTYTGS